MKNDTQKEMLLNALESALASFNVLFEQITRDGMRGMAEIPDKAFADALGTFLRKVSEEVNGNRKVYADKVSAAADSIDAANALCRCVSPARPFRVCMDDALFDALLRIHAADASSLLKDAADPSSPFGLSLCHACQFARSVTTVFQQYPGHLLTGKEGALSRLSPRFLQANPGGSFFCRSMEKGIGLELLQRLERSDIFSKGRAFRHSSKGFTAVSLKTVRTPEEFYGYVEAKHIISQHLDAFVAGKHNLPLLISGLPGLGKTQMTISFTLARKELSLVLPSPEDLQDGLEALISRLAESSKKFVIFFDDIDTRTVEWYHFRTFVGGSFSLPVNLMICIASNFRFPPNISSRGRVFTFPLFDEIRCQEMIEDLFLSRGMKKVAPDLLSVVAADYVEAFGQKEFDELSPRTLARYLELYLDNPAKRKRLLELSKGEVITRPDPQAFYEQNIKLLRALCGEEAVKEIREEEISL